MTDKVTDMRPAPQPAGLLDRLVVRGDVISRGFFLQWGMLATAAITIFSLPIIAITGSRTLAGMVIVLGLVFPVLFVAAGIRAF